MKRTLHFGSPAHLSTKNEQLVIKRDGETDVTIPIEDIGYVIIDHYGISITKTILQKLTENNSAVIITDEKHMPTGLEARAVYESIEQVRCESLAIRRFNGVSKNLGALLDEQCKSKGLGDLTEQNDDLLPEAVGLLVRESLTGEPTPKSADGLMHLWRNELENKIGNQIRKLRDCPTDQAQFAALVTNLNCIYI